jgi:hypothetical protein
MIKSALSRRPMVTSAARLDLFTVWLRLKYELYSVGWLLLALMAAFALLGWWQSNDTVGAANKIRSLMPFLALGMGMAVALLPNPLTDRAWELSQTAAEPDGSRDLGLLGLALLGVLAGFAVVLALLGQPALAWEWLGPRLVWFVAPAFLAFSLSRSTALTVGVGLMSLVLPYCPLPLALNPLLLHEPRAELYGLMALLGAAAPLARRLGQPTQRPRLLGLVGLGLLVALLCLWPLWRVLWPSSQQQAAAPAGWPTPALVLLASPWGRPSASELAHWQEQAQKTAVPLVLASVAFDILPASLAEAKDGTALANSLGIARYPMVLKLENGLVKVVE